MTTPSSGASSGGTWEVRLRGVYLDTANQSDAIPSLGVPQNAIHVNSKGLPDIDVEYFFLPNWSAELIASYPQVQEVTVSGTPIGNFRHLPPVLTVKYDFLPGADFQPYIGLGVNFTLIYDVNLYVPHVSQLTTNPNSAGVAVQGGFDYKVDQNWYLNADIKWVQLGTPLYATALDSAKVSTIHINPLLFGVGIGYRF